MLQSVRENLKNKVVFGIIIFIMAIMVIGGMGSINLSSLGQNSVVDVAGENISARELDREMNRLKSQLESQGEDPSSARLQRASLRQLVLPQLLSRKAFVASGKEGGLGVSDEMLVRMIREQKEFLVDGKFDLPTYRRLLNQAGFTPSDYKDFLRDEYYIRQQYISLSQSDFTTDSEFSLLAKILKEKRQFFEISIPQTEVEKDIVILDEEIQAYYDANSSEFQVPSKMVASYINVSLDDLAKNIPISEEEIKAQYESELADLKETSAEYEVAHILLSDENASKTPEVEEKLKAGETFEELAKTYSDDSGSKNLGGSLGVMTAGMFDASFEDAVKVLGEGEVSPAVKTDAGTHFIKLVKKSVQTPPTYDERKDAIKLALQRSAAEEEYVEITTRLDELSLGNQELEPIAQELGLEVQTTDAFEQNSGNGIVSTQPVRNAMFSAEVVEDDINTPLLNISNAQAVVLRKKAFEPARILSLTEVTSRIVPKLKEQKTQEKLVEIALELQDAIKEGREPESLAKSNSYEFKQHDLTERTNVNIDFLTLRSAFEIPLSVDGDIAFSDIKNSKGNRVLIGLQSVEAGSADEYSDQEKSAFKSQLSRSNIDKVIAAYQGAILDYYDVNTTP